MTASMKSEADITSPTGPASSEFTVLHRDFETDQGDDNAQNSEKDAKRRAKREIKRGDLITKISRTLQEDFRGHRPLRIVFVGKHGSGKSSFINTVAAAFSEDVWHEYAYTGFHGGVSEQSQGTTKPITVFTQRFDKCCNDKLERYRDVPLPTLIDVAGKMDIGDDKMEELLRLLFYGHIQEDSAIQKAFEFCERHTRDEIRAEYSQSYPEMKVDRILFVASATDKIPEKLIDCVMRAARPAHYTDVRRSVPVFGVLTKKDKVSDLNGTDFLEKKDMFMRGLGLHANRFLCCSNYCDDIDPKGLRTQQLDPSIDVPVLEFFQQLCDSALKVIQDAEELPGTGHQTDADKKSARQNPNQSEGEHSLQQQLVAFWGGLDRTGQALVATVCVFVAVWLVLYLVMVLPAGDVLEATLREKCNKGDIKDQALLDACKLSQPSSPMFRTTVASFTAAAGCFAYMVVGRGRA